MLAALAPRGHLINVSRGIAVDEAALCDALEAGTIAGAALDVYEREPAFPERLIKLGIAIGAMRESAVHSSVRKALALGITQQELDQVVALAAGTLGLPSTVAIYSWIRDVLERA